MYYKIDQKLKIFFGAHVPFPTNTLVMDQYADIKFETFTLFFQIKC
jgi:hypothetical protein